MTVNEVTVPAPTPAAKNPFARIAGVFYAPGDTFADIARKPDVLVPLLVILAISYVTTFMVMPYLDWDAMIAQQTEMMKAQNPNLRDADLEPVAKFTKIMGKAMAFVGPPIIVIGYLIIALVCWGACRLMGGEGNFKQAFSATLYAHMPRMVLSIITGIIVMARGSVNPMTLPTIVMTNVAAIAQLDMQTQPILYTVGTIIELFKIWTLILLIFGFAALSKLSKVKTAVIIISVWLVWLVVRVGFAALGAMRMKS